MLELHTYWNNNIIFFLKYIFAIGNRRVCFVLCFQNWLYWSHIDKYSCNNNIYCIYIYNNITPTIRIFQFYFFYSNGARGGVPLFADVRKFGSAYRIFNIQNTFFLYLSFTKTKLGTANLSNRSNSKWI